MHKTVGKTPVAAAPIGSGISEYPMGTNDFAPIYEPDPIGYVPIEETPIVVPPAMATETYIVRKGDTLSQLAVDFDTTTAELVRLNNLANPDVLQVGQELRVPAGRRPAPPSSGSSGSSSGSIQVKKGGTYVIQKGDTLSEIALAAGVSIDSLRRLNNIEGDRIIAGETLDIPEGGTIPPTQSSTPPRNPPDQTDTNNAGGALAVPGIAPIDDDTAPEGTPPSASIGQIEQRIYYPGESLDDIAREYGVTKAEIMRLNGITDESQIKDGQSLRIPIAE